VTLLTLIVAWLWQGIAIASFTAIVLRGMPRLSAATRYAIWWLALAAVIALPIVRIVAAVTAAASSRDVHEPIASAIVIVPAMSRWVVSCGIAIWSAAAIAGAVRLAAAVHHIARLRRVSRPFDAEREARLPLWMSIRQLRRQPSLRIADMSCSACVLGPVRPAIVVSQRLVDALEDDALDQIVMHERAHLIRFDDWSRLAQAIIAIVAGLHPAVRFITRQIDLEREAACDDLVVSRTGATRRYAVCLADAAAIAAGAFDATLMPSAIGSPSMLRARVARLLEPRRLRTPRPAVTVCAAWVVLLAGFVVGSKDVTPVVMVLESRAAPVVDSAELRWTERFDVPGTTLIRGPSTRARPEPFDSTLTLSSSKGERLAQDRLVERWRSLRTGLTKGERFAHDKPVVRRTRRTVTNPSAEISPALQARTVDVDETTAPLNSRPLEHTYDAPASTPYAARPPDAPAAPMMSADDASWIRTADAGIAIGNSAKRTGLAIGGFFTRAGKAIGKSF